MYHYVYRLEHTETMEYYIGSRSSKLHPTMDKYMGSMRAWKPDKTKLSKSILEMDFSDRDLANEYERMVIIESVADPLNRNKNIPGIGFHTAGMVQVKDNMGKCFLVPVDDESLKNGEVTYYWKDKKHSDEARKKMSESAKIRKIIPENEIIRREKISINSPQRGIPRSEEFKENLSKTRIGENNPYLKYMRDNNIVHHSKGKKYNKMECPHCNRMIAISIIHVAHMNNCKYKIDENKI